MVVSATEIGRNDPFNKYTNPKIAQKKAYSYLGNTGILYKSTRKDKKYMVKDDKDKWVHFGALPYEDYTKHRNKIRRKSYLSRATNIRGDWWKNKYSPNCLAINILW
tara:strand:- start:3226 stop:3546 length:321 start_codon:yes stop_codon:yes gene_type:complete